MINDLLSLLEQFDIGVPKCPECDEDLICKLVEWNIYGNVRADFYCKNITSDRPHVFSWESQTCVLCHGAAPFATTPCTYYPPNRHPYITIRKDRFGLIKTDSLIEAY